MINPGARSILAMVLVTAATCSGTAVADDVWRHEATIYMIGASIDGEASIGSLDTSVDVGFDDILANLEFGAMLSYRGERGRWAVVGDVIYMALEQQDDGRGLFGRTRIKVEGDQLMTELDLSYAVAERLDVYGGLRYWQLDSELNVFGGGLLGQTLTASETENWLDPVVGLRSEQPLGKRWTLVARGDVGGFSVGSDFTWHVTVYGAWAMTPRASLLVGYRHIDVDYDDGTGDGHFRWDVAQGGPAVGLTWRF
ncbi:MAG: hypothetical protein IT486_00060 [Gammaproteobacteria bacterium]|nr:hypothetical protein [Gammaproteobacteria bacterium]